MKKSFGIQPWQIQRIHIAKQQVKLSEEDYRALLANFNNADGIPCRSSKELTEQQANALLDIFRNRLGWKEKRVYKESKFSIYSGRDSKFASIAQLELIDRRWYKNPNVQIKTDEALNHFISRILKVDHISFVLKKDVQRLLKAIQSISPSPLQGEGRGEVPGGEQ